MHVRRFALSEGMFFEEDDIRRVAVLGSSVAEALDVGVGDEIRVRGVPFDVIGILAPRGVAADGSDEDNQLLVPLRTAMRRVFNTTSLNTIFISVRDPERMEDARAEVTTLLRARHGRDDFGVQNTARMMTMQQQVADSLTLFGTGLGALALLVGGTGILALMMMSVRERTGEIGLRIAVGATPRDILAQFLIEATLLALGGWLAGLAIGALGAAAVALATEWSTALPTHALLASAVMVLIAGLGFGSVPARKASRLPPIEALLA
jgi:putative ABC transport system permease protein